MRKIVINTIPHENQRYETCGDFWTDRDGIEQIRVSYMKDWKYCFLVYLHELVELGLTRQAGIKEQDITAFDMKFEAERERGLHAAEDEPGDDKRAPYRKAHRIATKIEKMAAKALGVDWKEYEKEVNSL